jgi:hypothetical protein
MMMQGGHDAGAMAQMRDIHELFANHDRMTRTVTNLPDGIRTVTESSDPQVAKLITDHVASSRKQVETVSFPFADSKGPVDRCGRRVLGAVQAGVGIAFWAISMPASRSTDLSSLLLSRAWGAIMTSVLSARGASPDRAS